MWFKEWGFFLYKYGRACLECWKKLFLERFSKYDCLQWSIKKQEDYEAAFKEKSPHLNNLKLLHLQGMRTQFAHNIEAVCGLGFITLTRKMCRTSQKRDLTINSISKENLNWQAILDTDSEILLSWITSILPIWIHVAAVTFGRIPQLVNIRDPMFEMR